MGMAIAVLAALAAGTGRLASRAPNLEMAAAAQRFLESLTSEQCARASLAFESRARRDWHYVPRRRDGVGFAEMSEPQRIAARDLMHAALSSGGVGKAEAIMLLEGVLREMERGAGPQRDPLAYSVCVFGTPGDGAWGWKVEGHHLSLNFTGVGDRTAVTPAFFGANPAEVKRGDRAGLRVLAAEEDLGRALLASLNREQRERAVIGEHAPADITAVPGRSLDTVDLSGLAVSEMDADQREIVERLLAEYAGNMRHEFAARELERIRGAGMEQVRFAWMGRAARGEGSYYRLSGPTFVIEYDNTQDQANHVHTVWRDRERDFGHDLLKEHYERGHEHGEK